MRCFIVFQETAPPKIMLAICRRQSMGKKAKYSKEILTFALTLQFYSSKGYEYVRSKFACLLPSIETLRKYYARVDAKPGFSKEAFRFLKSRAEKRRTVVNLVLDEMSIHRGVQVRGNRTFGFVNLGESRQEEGDNLAEATSALVFLAVNLRENFRVPVAYFLIHGLNDEERANLLSTALKMLHEINVNVYSVTFDGTAVNLSMVAKCGANVEYGTRFFQPWFSHPSTGKKVYVIPDPVHMLKLVRNRLGRTMWVSPNEPILDSEGGQISFRDIADLHELQEHAGLHASNKLTRLHIDYKNKIMNVKLATQTLSNSVSIALGIAQGEGLLQDVDATMKFCKIFNDLFDILNNRSMFPSKVPPDARRELFKKPLNDENLASIQRRATEGIHYIAGLREPSGRLVIHSPTKTGFLGFIITLTNIFPLYNELKSIDGYEFTTLLTYRLLQDYIENFFECIRSRGGFNDNPTALQFEIAYKYMLIHTEIRSSENGNCEVDDVEIFNCSSVYRPEGEIDDEEDLDFDFPDDIVEDLNSLSSFVIEIVTYISGFISKKVRRLTTCAACQDILVDPDFEQETVLLFKKNVGGLTVPSALVCDLCTVTECEFRRELAKSNRFEKFSNRIVSRIMSRQEVDTNCATCHDRTQVLHHILETYIRIRIHYECKKLSLPQGQAIRQKLNKLTQNLHQ